MLLAEDHAETGGRLRSPHVYVIGPLVWIYKTDTVKSAEGEQALRSPSERPPRKDTSGPALRRTGAECDARSLTVLEVGDRADRNPSDVGLQDEEPGEIDERNGAHQGAGPRD